MNHHYEIYRDGHHKLEDRRPESKWQSQWRTIYEVGQESKQALELSKIVGRPIFVVERTHRKPRTNNFDISIDALYPVTADMGLAHFYAADQLYQDAAYWIANILKPSPDVLPAGKPAQTDLEKIAAHGMDIKQSFRHRPKEDK